MSPNGYTSCNNIAAVLLTVRSMMLLLSTGLKDLDLDLNFDLDLVPTVRLMASLVFLDGLTDLDLDLVWDPKSSRLALRRVSVAESSASSDIDDSMYSYPV